MLVFSTIYESSMIDEVVLRPSPGIWCWGSRDIGVSVSENLEGCGHSTAVKKDTLACSSLHASSRSSANKLQYKSQSMY
jgi:hypothetical protein